MATPTVTIKRLWAPRLGNCASWCQDGPSDVEQCLAPDGWRVAGVIGWPKRRTGLGHCDCRGGSRLEFYACTVCCNSSTLAAVIGPALGATRGTPSQIALATLGWSSCGLFNGFVIYDRLDIRCSATAREPAAAQRM